jgi:protein-tyrosine phosphatase
MNIMLKNILFVCTGNICRSPMGEYLLKSMLTVIDNQKINVSSAGTHSLVNFPADKPAQELMLSKGIDMSAHRARQLDDKILYEANLILTMTLEQQKYIEKIFPNACGRVHRVGKWDEFDVMDPFKRPQVIYKQVYALLEKGINDWYRKLWA